MVVNKNMVKTEHLLKENNKKIRPFGMELICRSELISGVKNIHWLITGLSVKIIEQFYRDILYTNKKFEIISYLNVAFKSFQYHAMSKYRWWKQCIISILMFYKPCSY